MNGTGGKNPPLVADRRYAAKAAPQTARNSQARSTPPPRRGGGGGNGGGNGGNGGGNGRKGRSPRRRGPSNPVARVVLAIWNGIWRVIWGGFWRLIAVMVLVLAGATAYFYSQLPELDKLLDARTRGSVTMLDDNGETFAWRGETFGGQITAKTVSPNLKNAIVATEDKRFYHHFGISPQGIIGAMRINLSEGRKPFEGNGGSTITQQVAKLLCLGVPYDPATWKTEADYEADCRASTIWRKLKEIPYSFALETKYGKDNVLTIYLNRAYLGAGTRGFEAAAERYFGKSASDVNAAEGAMLAGLLKAPTRYAPTNNLERAQQRANVIIGLEEEQGYLTAAQADAARKSPAELSEAAARKSGGYFADWVMEEGPDFLTRDTTEDVLIRTTLDQRIQAAAERGVDQVFKNKLKDGSKAQVAVVVMSADGAVRAMVGGRDTAAPGGFNRATMAVRQPGSTFKPFVYAAALDAGFPPSSVVMDAPLTINVPGSGPWSPDNFEVGQYRGQVDLTTALEHSINTATVRVQETVGRDKVRSIAEGFGFAHDLAQGPALALGVSGSTLIDMTGAYAGFLNQGQAVKPYGIVSLQLKGDDAPLLGKDGGDTGVQVISRTAARQLVYMMTQVVQKGTGGRARLGDREVAGKTGTTQNSRDAWFIGFTGNYVAGVWMGYDDNSPMKGVTGGGLPAEIWHEVMARVTDGVPAVPLPMDPPTVANPEPVPQPDGFVAQNDPSIGTPGDSYRAQGNQGGDQQRRQEPSLEQHIDRAVRNVLGALFGN